ncbi:MAG: hypothetical protein KAX20_04865, partial [Candidatus Omnitrophica bacterium]|nr:hypothetical protein [Candidatus Omnitrophota bacterium]
MKKKGKVKEEAKEMVVTQDFSLVPSDVKAQLDVIRNFQALVKQNLILEHDFGTIPGTKKPTLYKPGAEKIVKLMKCYDHHEILDKVEDWDKPLFSYTMRTTLFLLGTDHPISDGVGECNSMETKYYYKWVYESELPKGMDKTQFKKNQYGKYRVKNDPDEIATRKNTLLKMAKKRALVDAVLSASRLSDIFTQDMEDIQGDTKATKTEPFKSTTPADPMTPTQKTTIENRILNSHHFKEWERVDLQKKCEGFSKFKATSVITWWIGDPKKKIVGEREKREKAQAKFSGKESTIKTSPQPTEKPPTELDVLPVGEKRPETAEKGVKGEAKGKEAPTV